MSPAPGCGRRTNALASVPGDHTHRPSCGVQWRRHEVMQYCAYLSIRLLSQVRRARAGRRLGTVNATAAETWTYAFRGAMAYAVVPHGAAVVPRQAMGPLPHPVQGRPAVNTEKMGTPVPKSWSAWK